MRQGWVLADWTGVSPICKIELHRVFRIVKKTSQPWRLSKVKKKRWRRNRRRNAHSQSVQLIYFRYMNSERVEARVYLPRSRTKWIFVNTPIVNPVLLGISDSPFRTPTDQLYRVLLVFLISHLGTSRVSFHFNAWSHTRSDRCNTPTDL